jgi:hypothetical protein
MRVIWNAAQASPCAFDSALIADLFLISIKFVAEQRPVRPRLAPTWPLSHNLVPLVMSL